MVFKAINQLLQSDCYATESQPSFDILIVYVFLFYILIYIRYAVLTINNIWKYIIKYHSITILLQENICFNQKWNCTATTQLRPMYDQCTKTKEDYYAANIINSFYLLKYTICN